MSFSRITKIAAIGAFAVAIPLAIGTPAFATTSTDAHQTVAHQPNNKVIVTFTADADGPTAHSAVDAAKFGIDVKIKNYQYATGGICVVPTSYPVVATQIGPELWHATATVTATCTR